MERKGDLSSEKGDTTLRVLICDGARLEAIGRTVAELGHEVIARESPLTEVARLTEIEHPDVALVIVRDGTASALAAIDQLVHEAVCPVIAILDVEDGEFIKEAAKRGIFAYIADGELGELQSSIDIVLRRFAEYHGLAGAFARRAVTERAKGILMERHGISDQEAFEMLRDQARQTRRKLLDIAEAVALGHRVLPRRNNPSPD